MLCALTLLLTSVGPPGCNKPSEDLSALASTVMGPGMEPSPVVPERIPYSLVPGDELNIRLIGGEEDLRDLTFRVNADGGFQYPYLGPVRAEGLTTDDLRKKITQQLEPYFVDPNIVVNLTSREQLFVNVLGEVRSPGAVQLDPRMRITDAIARAGDITQDGSQQRVILIRRTADDQVLAGFFNYKEAMLNPLAGAYASNIPLERGDIVFVPRNDRAQWESAFQFIGAMFDPIIDAERAIVLYPDVREILKTGDKEGGTTVIVR